MRLLTFVLLPLLCAPHPARGQTMPPAPLAQHAASAVDAALLGRWIGVLEYRDYSEPASSTKRVQLPTWLTIRPAPEGVSFDYTYDDGPAKTVVSHSAIAIDTAAQTYQVSGTGASPERYVIAGLEKLRDGRGELILSGQGTDNQQPAEIRTALTIRRNLLSWLEEVRPAGSMGPLSFATATPSRVPKNLQPLPSPELRVSRRTISLVVFPLASGHLPLPLVVIP